MQTKNILGIKLNFYSLREALEHSDFLLKNGALSTIQYITTKMLVQSSKDEHCHQLLDSMDMLICAEPTILRAAGINARSRIYEVEKRLYFKELCRLFQTRQTQIYILADTQEQLKKFLSVIHSYPDGNFSATVQTLDALKGSREFLSLDAIANEINDVAPDIILSCLDFPYQMKLMNDLKPYLNARVWLGFPPDPGILTARKPSFLRKLGQLFFRKQVSRYQSTD